MNAPELTTEQWEELIEQYTQIIVDGMDWKDMERFVFDTIQRDLSELESRQDLCDDIQYTVDEELLEELVDNVTSVPPKVERSFYPQNQAFLNNTYFPFLQQKPSCNLSKQFSLKSL